MWWQYPQRTAAGHGAPARADVGTSARSVKREPGHLASGRAVGILVIHGREDAKSKLSSPEADSRKGEASLIANVGSPGFMANVTMRELRTALTLGLGGEHRLLTGRGRSQVCPQRVRALAPNRFCQELTKTRSFAGQPRGWLRGRLGGPVLIPAAAYGRR